MKFIFKNEFSNGVIWTNITNPKRGSELGYKTDQNEYSDEFLEKTYC